MRAVARFQIVALGVGPLRLPADQLRLQPVFGRTRKVFQRLALHIG